MKNLNYVSLLCFMLFLIVGCSKEELAPELDQNDQTTSSLKAAKVKTEFSGVCVAAPGGAEDYMEKLLPNDKLKAQFYTVWHDYPYDNAHWMVKGQTTWYVKQIIEENGEFKYWGKCELLVDDDGGVWQMTWRGYLTFTETGPQLIAYAVGQGKSGDVKGMVGEWTYTFNFAAGEYDYVGVYH